jgi:EamA domain-containing membrane protein RarD
MVKETPSLPYVGFDCGVKLSEAELKSMLTVRANAESGGQSVRIVGLQLVYVWAVAGAMRHAAEASAARALMVERMLLLCCGLVTIEANEGRRVVDVAQFIEWPV